MDISFFQVCLCNDSSPSFCTCQSAQIVTPPKVMKRNEKLSPMPEKLGGGTNVAFCTLCHNTVADTKRAPIRIRAVRDCRQHANGFKDCTLYGKGREYVSTTVTKEPRWRSTRSRLLVNEVRWWHSLRVSFVSWSVTSRVTEFVLDVILSIVCLVRAALWNETLRDSKLM